MNCVKSVRIWSFSGPHFPEFRLNTVSLYISLYMYSICNSLKKLLKQPKTLTCYICCLVILNLNISLLYIYIYGIHHWQILWSSCRKLAWVEFEPTTTKFRSHALTDWAIIWPRVQLRLRANFVQLLQFHRLFSVTFHFGYCLRQSPRLF